MQLIGMLDSPYVRRAFISARLLGVPFEHRALSVFRNFDEFHAINPLVKAPTLVLDSGEVLADSNMLIAHFEDVAAEGHSLLPADPAARVRCHQITGLALAACDKSVQLYYEIGLRPEERRWGAWIERCSGQVRDTYRVLEAKVAQGRAPWLCGDAISQADVSAAVAWRFTRYVLPDILDAGSHPALAALSARAEALPEFLAADFD